MSVSVVARGLTKSFGSRRVISQLNLDIPAGQFLAVVGRSGCGKSTLLRLLSGLEQPDEGTVTLDAGDGRATARVMFQEPRLLPWLRVGSNVAVGLGPEAEAPRALEAARVALRDVMLEDRIDAWPTVLSGGQKQRVALARALVSRPALLAFDEPLGALDALTRIEMQQLIARIAQRDGFTSLLVTHDVTEAVDLADRIVVLENGAITLDLRVDLPRAHRRGSPESQAITNRVLDRLLGKAAA
jgi:sulfonate transport system ATP-binding protein